MITQKEQCIGLSTLACVRFVVAENPQVKTINLRAYRYIPNKVSGPDEQDDPIERDEFFRDDVIDGAISSLPDSETNLSVSSRVTLQNSEVAHFAMMDLAPRKGPEALEKVRQQLTKIVVPQFGSGIILETNKSYQFLGLKTLNSEEWLNFLGLNLITSIVRQIDENQPRQHEFIADYRYIGHSLLRRSTGLRITTRGTKTFSPVAIATI